MAFDVDGARKAGYSETEIADHLAQQHKFDSAAARQSGYTDADIVSHLVAKTPVQSFDKKAGGAAERFGRGLFEPAVGTAQLAANALADDPVRMTAARIIPGAGPIMQAVEKLIGLQGFQDFKERQNRFATEMSQAQDEIAPEGFDVARLAGNITGLAPTAAIGGPGGTIPQLIGRGAASGAAAGATMPVADADEGYAAQKVKDTAIGAAAGAAANPIAQKAIGAIGKGLSGAKAAIRPKMSAADIKVQINQVLQNEGVDLSKLPKTYVDDVAREVRTALQAGGKLDERSLTNIATAKMLGIDLTKGQATQQPGQYAREMFIRQAQGGEGLQTQYVGSLTRLNQNIDDLARGSQTQPPVLNVEAGRRALDALKEADKPTREGVSRLYEAARGMVGIDEPLDQVTMVNRTFDRLQEAGVVDKLPGQFVTALNKMSKGEAPLTMREAQMMIRAANGRIGASNDPVEKTALRIFKNSVDEAVEDVGSKAGQDAATAFKLARESAAKRFQRIDKIPVLKEALDDDLAPDDFMRKAIYNAKLDDMKNLRAYLRSNNKPAWNQIRSQVLADIKQTATGGSDEPASFSQAAFNRQLNTLKQSGKLNLLFSPSEIKTLEAVGRVGRLIQMGPPGVLRTGAMGAAQSMDMLMGILGKLPLLGRAGGLATALGRRGANVLEASASVRPPVLAPLVSAIPEDVAGRLATLSAAAPAIAIEQAQ